MVSFSTYLTAFLLFVVYAAAAVPWVTAAFFRREQLAGALRGPGKELYQGLADWRVQILRGAAVIFPPLRFIFPRSPGQGLLVVLGAGVVVFVVAVPLLMVYALFQGAPETSQTVGMFYGATLQLQLIVDFFLIAFPLLLLGWPKGAAVALAAFREGVRQPLFWVLLAFGVFALCVSPVIPYFTFGEDLVMVKDLGFDFMLALAALFGALAASQSISEEIEGRTAVTLMSKPVSRRQFLLGKFLGILLAALLLFGLLSWVFQGTLQAKLWLDRADPTPTPGWVTAAANAPRLEPGPTHFLTGVGLWTNHTLDVLPGLVMTFSAVMVLIAVATVLATRATVVVNLATVASIYFLANLTPVLVFIGKRAKAQAGGSGDPVAELVSFTAGVFDTILPDLDAFRIGPALTLGTAVPVDYMAKVFFYGLLYTLILMLFGLILFEDRDLA